MHLQKNYSNSTAILLFAQSEKVEGSLKPITSSVKQNILLWKKMNGLVLNTLQKTKLPYFISNEKNQIGSTFGAKLTHAIQEIFEKGFEKVIVVGNDCIALNAQHLRQAEHDLQCKNLVIGADFSGGAYLIGVSKATFNAEKFEQLPWQTKNLFTALASLHLTHSIAVLPSLHDCNTTADFKKALHQLPYASFLKKMLLSFLFLPKQQNKFETNYNTFLYSSQSFNKGSPF